MLEVDATGSDDGEARSIRSIKTGSTNKYVERILVSTLTDTACFCELCHSALYSGHIVFAHCLLFLVSNNVLIERAEVFTSK